MANSVPRLTKDQAAALYDGVLAISGVHSLSPGRFGHKALLFPGERFPGLSYPQVEAGQELRLAVDVVVAREGLQRLRSIADECRRVASAHFPGPIDVTIADVADVDVSQGV